MNVFIISLKLSETEKLSIESAIDRSVVFQSSRHLPIQCIVTNILTTQRIKRECLNVWSDEPASVLSPAAFLDICSSRADQPFEAVRHALQAVVRLRIALPRKVKHSYVRPQASDNNLSITEPVKLSQPVASSTPRLLQHESTGDPTTLLFHQQVELRCADSSWRNKYACQRRSPLICPNQALVDLLRKLKLKWQIEDDERRVRAYSTAIASIKAYPIKIQTGEEVTELEGCGPSFFKRVCEFMQTGKIKEVDEAWQSEPLLTKFTFWNVHGLGAKGVSLWYNERGYRSLNDAISSNWYALTRPQQLGVKYYDDFLLVIDRREVESIAKTVHDVAQKVLGQSSPVSSTCCGGYRRGKAESGDVDIVLTHVSINDTAQALRAIVQMLESISFLQEVISERHERDGSKQHLSGYAVGLVVCRLPEITEKAKKKLPMRRLDVIVARPDNYVSAILGWSGSITFERDLRLHARNSLGINFDSTGLTTLDEPRQRIDSSAWTWAPGLEVEALEMQLFKRLALEFIEPRFRNAD